uniref:Uncharacterized protein n=1 Tax=Zea mays TaxID=4577 RepID=B4FXI6_MAIZE|nr:unknown [Zea mays]
MCKSSEVVQGSLFVIITRDTRHASSVRCYRNFSVPVN